MFVFNRLMIPIILYIIVGGVVYQIFGTPWAVLAVVGGIMYIDLILLLRVILGRLTLM